MSSSAKMVGVMTVITVAVFTTVIMFYFHIESINAGVVQIEREAKVAQAEQEEAQSTQELLENNKEDIELLDSYILPEDGVPSFLSRIESIGSTTGSKVVTQSVSVVSQTNTDEDSSGLETETVLVAVSAEGSWGSVFHTLSLIENLPLKVEVTSVSFSRNNVTEGSAAWNATIQTEVLKKQN